MEYEFAETGNDREESGAASGGQDAPQSDKNLDSDDIINEIGDRESRGWTDVQKPSNSRNRRQYNDIGSPPNDKLQVQRTEATSVRGNQTEVQMARGERLPWRVASRTSGSLEDPCSNEKL